MLSDQLLIRSFQKAAELQLHSDFVRLLTQEMKRRNLFVLSKES
ncbi:sporulation histidine kinase inhibitor Sda [Bacillus taeanensis]